MLAPLAARRKPARDQNRPPYKSYMFSNVKRNIF